MRTLPVSRNLIAVAALAAFFSTWEVNAALAAKEVFVRSKPHVNVGTIAGEPALMWFHANARVSENGEATGTLQIRVRGGESFLYRVVGGEATVVDDDVVELILILVRVGEDGTPTGETDIATVLPSSTIEPCRIYDIAGTQVHVEAKTVVGFRGLRHEHIRP